MKTQELLRNEREYFKKLLISVIGNDASLNVSIALADAVFMRIKNCRICYQVMIDEPFFEWYCFNFEDAQFFATPAEAVAKYLKHRFEWFAKGQPQWDSPISLKSRN